VGSVEVQASSSRVWSKFKQGSSSSGLVKFEQGSSKVRASSSKVRENK